MSKSLNTKLHIAMLVFLIVASAGVGLYVRAEAEEAKKVEEKVAASAEGKPIDPEREKIKKEYTEMRKKEYLLMVKEQEKSYRKLADEMKNLYKSCSGDDKDACKKAKEQASLVRKEIKEDRSKNSKRFEALVDEYRKKLGKGEPTDVEKERKELKAKKKAEKAKESAE